MAKSYIQLQKEAHLEEHRERALEGRARDVVRVQALLGSQVCKGITQKHKSSLRDYQLTNKD